MTNDRDKSPRPSALNDGLILLLDLDCEHLDDALDEVTQKLAEHHSLTDAQRERVDHVLSRRGDVGVDALEHGVAIAHERIRDVEVPPMWALVRTTAPISLERGDEGNVRFLWVFVTRDASHPRFDTAAEFAHLMRFDEFRAAALEAGDHDALEAAYLQALDDEIGLKYIPPELRATGRPFGGAVLDLKRRLPHWVDDWRAGLNTKVLASVLFMFFACLAPAVAFGFLLITLAVRPAGLFGR